MEKSNGSVRSVESGTKQGEDEKQDYINGSDKKLMEKISIIR